MVKNEVERTAWFKRARFGMFIHWGIYAVLGRGEWAMNREDIDPEKYRNLADDFKPRYYDPQDWARLARRAGARYMVLTTRHHDGFSLFDSEADDFTAPKTGPGRDLIAEYVKACRAEDLRVGFYYSPGNWSHPGYRAGPDEDPELFKDYIDYVHRQVEELLTNYGKVDLLWFDGCFRYGAEEWRTEELVEKIFDLQPEIVINDRLSGFEGDYDTPEQRIEPSDRLWESCMTMNDSWGYHGGDNNWKTTKQLVSNLIQCVSGGGNYLLNVGPTAEGLIPYPSRKRLEEIGSWLEESGESIYGAGETPLEWSNWGKSTAKGEDIYLQILYWPGKEMEIAGLKGDIKRAILLSEGAELKVEETAQGHYKIKGLPETPPDELCSTIKLEMTGQPEKRSLKP